MPDSKITALASIGTGTDPANDPLVLVDVSDTSMAASGTTKKVTLNNLLACSPTATLASATITGDLTVDTNVLKVDTTLNRVGIGTATPGYLLDVQAATAVANILSTTGTNTAYLQISNTGGYFYLGRENSAGTTFAAPAYSAVLYAGGAYPLVTTVNGGERYRIASDGVATWSNVGGVAGTAMTLNSTGLGVGAVPAVGFDLQQASPMIRITGTSTTGYSTLTLRNTGASGRTYGITVGGSGTGATAAGNLYISDDTASAVRLTLDSAGNVGIGVTPSAKLDVAGNARVQLAFFTGGTIPGLTNENPFAYRVPGGGLGLGAATETATTSPIIFYTGQGGVERVRVKGAGQLRFFPLAADPAGAEAGDVYYNSSSNKLKCYNGSTWNDLF